jgi:outer membrane protein OmpA-like peptidoglycan-associated protein
MRKQQRWYLSATLVSLSLLLRAQQVPVEAGGGSMEMDVDIFNAVSINTALVDFSPTFYDNGLVYVSQLSRGLVDEKTGETFFKIFYAALGPDGLPGKPQPFSVSLSSPYHEGPVCFNQKADRIFFTRTNANKGIRRADQRGVSGLKIYEAVRGPFDWEQIKELPFNNDGYSCLHPALSADETKLFFASNRPDSYGGMDIYVSEWTGEQWSEPYNLGPEINTSKNDAFPFIFENGTLFFASEGHEGYGGYDLFSVDISGRRWGAVTNLGPPFNSSADDIGLILSPEGSEGYFTSARSGGVGKDDIYFFKFRGGSFPGFRESIQRTHELVVRDSVSGRGIMSAMVWLYERPVNSPLNQSQLYDLVLLQDSTQREVSISMVRKSEDDLGQAHYETDREGIAGLKLRPSRSYVLLIARSGYQTQEFQFDTDVEGKPLKSLQIPLSEVNCILLQGKIIAEQYNLPIPNAGVRIMSDCPQASPLNLYTNINGEFETCLPLGCNYTVQASKEGYLSSGSTVSTVRTKVRTLELSLALKPFSQAVLREPIAKGTVIVMNNIRYDFNQATIRSGAAQDLEGLATLMLRYPSMEIELSAHTDSRGSDAYNLDLSRRRADTAKDFLVQRGIAANRIQAAGYGERVLRNRCADGVECTEEEHAYNRRTEIKVLRIDENIDVQINAGE